MTLLELKRKMPEMENYDELIPFLQKHNIPYNSPFFGMDTIEDKDAETALRIFDEAHAADRLAKAEQERLAHEEAAREKEEAARKKKAMAQMLVTSGFTFDGYRITKYSGYISGDDAMTVSRGSSFTDGGVRDKLMASLSEIRRNALRELKEAAYDLGCNAVIGVDFDYITLDPQTANFSGGTTYQPYVFCVTANGNAVIIEKIEE